MVILIQVIVLQLNGKVIIDGVDLTPDSKEINISVVGDVTELRVDSCNKLHVQGNAGNINTKSGDVEISGDVGGNVQAMSGDVDISGNVGGSVSTMSGDIKYKKSV